jgi:hypothetical protein
MSWKYNNSDDLVYILVIEVDKNGALQTQIQIADSIEGIHSPIRVHDRPHTLTLCKSIVCVINSPYIYKQINSVVCVLKRTTPTERPPLVGEVNANVCGYRVPRGQRDGSLQPYSRLYRPESLLFLSSSSSVVLTRLSGPRSQTHYFSENLKTPGIELESPDL